MTEQIRVFVGTEPKQAEADKVLEYSIKANTNEEVEVVFMRNGEPPFDGWINHGPTGFTLFRFAIPELCDFEGYAIYLDCDMLVRGNIGELWRMARPGQWVTHGNREGDCVSVIDCSAVRSIPEWPSIAQLRTGNYRKWDVRKLMSGIKIMAIPDRWNSMDRLRDDTRLVHYTSLETQPWRPNPEQKYKDHQDAAACDLWFQYHELANPEELI